MPKPLAFVDVKVERAWCCGEPGRDNIASHRLDLGGRSGLGVQLKVRDPHQDQTFVGFVSNPKVRPTSSCDHAPFGVTPAKAPKYADVENIFNPFEPLADASAWLSGLDDRTFHEAARSLKSLLPLEPQDRLIRKAAGKPSDRIGARFGGATVSLDELSDGYQSVVALAADAIRVMLDQWSSMESAEGIIAIDELGAHMHPRWKMQLVSSLRRLFPRVQFIATTHDPLCLRGLRQGEVVVLNRVRGKGVFAITDLPAVEGLRADQLLTSEHFGLSSTLDPDTEAMFEEYYDLRAERTLTDRQAARLAELQGQLEGRDLMGRDRRERLMLEAIDQYLADVRDEAHPEKRARLRQAALDEAERIYAAVPPTPVSSA